MMIKIILTILPLRSDELMYSTPIQVTIFTSRIKLMLLFQAYTNTCLSITLSSKISHSFSLILNISCQHIQVHVKTKHPLLKLYRSFSLTYNCHHFRQIIDFRQIGILLCLETVFRGNI